MNIHVVRTVSGLSLLMLVVGCGTFVRSGDGGPHFSGRLLIGMNRTQAERVNAARSSGSADGDWTFKQVPRFSKDSSRATGAERVWVIASPSRGAPAGKGNPWDQAHAALDERGKGSVKSLLPQLSRAAGGDVTSAVIEPDFYFEQKLPKSEDSSGDSNGGGDPGVAFIGNPSSAHWPTGRTIDWYLSDEYSQLKKARDFARAKRGTSSGGREIKVALIDTGYNAIHISTPPRLNKQESRDFTGDPMRPAVGADDPFKKGKFDFPGHGTACLGVLAGNRVKVGQDEFDDDLGGAADFEVVVYRISDSVVHFFPANMAVAIKYAVAQGCDVISLSHGGLPSGMLAEAVNEAYENGTAIFAASGDFLEMPVLGWTTPETVVYPAAFNRVVAVCGATADRRSYGRSPGLMSLLLHWGDLKGWMIRGNYGPDVYMREAIAGYSPNVMWAQYSAEFPANQINLNGFGTSAATPQVAAAAALWLDVHKDDPLFISKWRSWEKVEAVYLALFDSAQKNTPEGGDSFKYFGNGLLKAYDALGLGVPKYMDKRPVATVGFGWIRTLAGIIPGVRSASQGETDQTSAAHIEMVQTEVAQLVHSSQKLQSKAVGLDLFAIPKTPSDVVQLREFCRLVRSEGNASKYLQKVLRRVEGELASLESAP